MWLLNTNNGTGTQTKLWPLADRVLVINHLRFVGLGMFIDVIYAQTMVREFTKLGQVMSSVWVNVGK